MAEKSGVTVIAENVSATLKGKGKNALEKRLLHEVNFFAEPGNMTAIMGPSGSGKTTFLNALAGRLGKTAAVEGDIYYGGQPNEVKNVNDFAAYVMQEDYFLEFLTVQETIVFAARLRLRHLAYADQVSRADQVMAELGLDPCRQVLIGGRTVKGVSGGQRKRVSIAVALLCRPAVLYLDEPTSGLDASLSYDVVKTLQLVAKRSNRTVVCTIHQPRSQVFALFEVLLLLRAGRVVYSGAASAATSYFASIGHTCPPSFNPPDFFLDILTADGTSEVTSSANLVGLDRAGSSQPLEHKGSAQRVVVSTEIADQFADVYADSDLYRKEQAARQHALTQKIELPRGDSHSNNLMAWISSVYILFLRGNKSGSRQPNFLYVNFASNIFMTIVIGTIWWQMEFPDLENPACDVTTTRNLLGGIMQMVGNTAFSCFDAGMLIISKRPLINREASGGLYHRSAALTANYLSDGMFHYWPNLFLATIVYWMMGFRKSAPQFFIWLLAAWILKFAYWGYSTWCGTMAPSVPAVSGMIPLGSVLLFLTSGFQLSDNEIPRWLSWLKNISPVRYAFQGIARNQIGDRYTEDCMGFRTPDGWLASFGLALCVGIAFRIFSYISFSYMNKQQGLQA